MKKFMLAVALLIMATVPGCQCFHQFTANVASQTTGLNRTVVLHDYSGNVIGKWASKTVIDADSGGLTTFFDSTGHRVLINGGILVSVER